MDAERGIASDGRIARRSGGVIAAGALSSGAALLLAIGLRLPLGTLLASLGLVTAGAVVWQWHRTPSAVRPVIRRRASVGVWAGLLGTLAYDGSRILLVRLADLPYRPFEALPLFGRLLAGASVSDNAALAVGTLYHYLNGVSFAVAYTFIFAGRRWIFGLLWALGLEVLMLAVYPTWLDLRAVRSEFTVVSSIGHLAYGAVIGIFAQRYLSPQRLTSPFRSTLPK
jgi:hypothetical protein